MALPVEGGAPVVGVQVQAALSAHGDHPRLVVERPQKRGVLAAPDERSGFRVAETRVPFHHHGARRQLIAARLAAEHPVDPDQGPVVLEELQGGR
jgi:hypothetical protein